MEDIDKDIETIWKELQELDKLPRSENGLPNRRKEDRYLLHILFKYLVDLSFPFECMCVVHVRGGILCP